MEPSCQGASGGFLSRTLASRYVLFESPIFRSYLRFSNYISYLPWGAYIHIYLDAAYLDPESAHTLQVTAWIPLLDAKAENGCMQVIKGGHRSGKTARHSCCAGGTWCVWSFSLVCLTKCHVLSGTCCVFKICDVPCQKISLLLAVYRTLYGFISSLNITTTTTRYVEMDMDDASDRLGVNCRDESQWVTCEMPMGSVLFLNNLIPHRRYVQVEPVCVFFSYPSLSCMWLNFRSFVCPSDRLSVCLKCLSVCLSFHPSVCLLLYILAVSTFISK